MLLLHKMGEVLAKALGEPLTVMWHDMCHCCEHLHISSDRVCGKCNIETDGQDSHEEIMHSDKGG